MPNQFLRVMQQQLVLHGFSLQSQGSDGPVWHFVKMEHPMFYLVTLVDAAHVTWTSYQQTASWTNARILDRLSDYHCSNLLSLHLYCSAQPDAQALSFVEQNEIIPGESAYSIFWLISLEDKKIITGQKQPNRVLDLYQCCQEALRQMDAPDTMIEEPCDVPPPLYPSNELPAKTEKHAVVFCLLGLLLFLWIFFSRKPGFVETYAAQSGLIWSRGQYYRLVSSMFIHVQLQHLAFNCLSLYIFGKIGEEHFGHIPFLVIYLFTGIVGGLASSLTSFHYSIGASGAIYGIIGALLALAFWKKKTVGGYSFLTYLQLTLVSLCTAFFLPNIDNAAHIGGLLAGIGAGTIFALCARDMTS